MDLATIIVIIVIIIVAYLLIKLIISPLIQIAVGIIILLVGLYILQRFFGFDLGRVFGGPFGKYLNLRNWGVDLNWILGPADHYINQIRTFGSFIWKNFTNANSANNAVK